MTNTSRSWRTERKKAPYQNELETLMQTLVIPKKGLSLKELDDHFGMHGTSLLIILLALPFLFPVPIPGVSTLFGFAIIALSLRFLWPSSSIPKWLGKRLVGHDPLKSLLAKCGPVLVRLESFGCSGRLRNLNIFGSFGVVAMVIFSALLLALPIPPIIPFTNTLPAIAIILLVFGHLRKDTLIVLLGITVVMIAASYFMFIGYSLFFATEWMKETLLSLTT